MELFSNIIKNFNINCSDEIIKKLIINQFVTNNNHKNTFHIGISSPDSIKKYKKQLFLLPLDQNFLNFSIKEAILKKKNITQFFSLSKSHQKFLKETFDIDSKILFFDFPNLSPGTKKIFHFHKISPPPNITSIHNLIQNEINSNNLIYNQIKLIKIIYHQNPSYLSIPILQIAENIQIKIKYTNYLFIQFTELIYNFNQKFPTFYDKFFFYKINFVKINNIFYSIIKENKNIVFINVKNNNSFKNIFISNSNENENFSIFISDDIQYLKNLNPHFLKIHIDYSPDTIIKKLENNFISINSYFLDEKFQKKFNDYFSKKISFENYFNKYIKLFQSKYNHFIITQENDIQKVQSHISILDKYNKNINIHIFSNISAQFTSSSPIIISPLSSFSPENNSIIYHSNNFDLSPFFKQIILKDNIIFKPIDKPTILISSTQYPSYGGAATNAYNIIKYLQKQKEITTIGIFIDTSDDIYEKANPDKIPNVIGYKYNDFNYDDILYKIYSQFKTIPDLAFCKNCMAPKIIKNIFPSTINIFLVSGIWGFSQITCGANQITDFTEIRKTPEEKSIKCTDLIICNSNLTIKYFQKIYNYCINNKLLLKPIDTTKYNVDELLNKTKNIYDKDKRDIDIIVISSNTNRPVKNIKFIKEILEYQLLNYKITIIGENAEELFGNLKDHLIIIPLISQQDVQKYLQKSKLILIPSLFDSNSNVFREAVFSGCFPIISENVAHPPKYPKFFVCDNYDPEDWIYRIKFFLEKYDYMFERYNLIKYFKNSDNIMDFVF